MTDNELREAGERNQPICQMGPWRPYDRNQPPGRVRTSVSVGTVEATEEGYEYVPSEGGQRVRITDANRDEFEPAEGLAVVYFQVG